MGARVIGLHWALFSAKWLGSVWSQSYPFILASLAIPLPCPNDLRSLWAPFWSFLPFLLSTRCPSTLHLCHCAHSFLILSTPCSSSGQFPSTDYTQSGLCLSQCLSPHCVCDILMLNGFFPECHQFNNLQGAQDLQTTWRILCLAFHMLIPLKDLLVSKSDGGYFLG